MSKKYEFDFHLKTRYVEYDYRDELKLSSLLTYLQEAGSAGAAQMGCDSDFLWARGWGFIVTGYYLEIYRSVPINSSLTVRTWALPPKHVIFERNYEFFSESGEKVAAATSRWCLLDINNRKILSASAIGETDAEDFRTDRVLNVPSWKIGEKERADEPSFVTKVSLSDYDHYVHVNNTHYADYCMNCFTQDEWRNVKSFQITYEKQCFIGDELKFYKTMLSSSEYLIVGKKEGEIFMKAKILFE